MQGYVVACAALAGAALGWLQFKLLQLTVEKRRTWLVAVKLPLWALPMLAAATVSVAALAGLAAGATVTLFAFAVIQWRGLRKGA